jgi:prepilin-type N-terminal cleavage/methylation domain-containing protein
MSSRADHTAQERRGGFTLVELMIVIAIIAVIAAIAIPNLLETRKAGDETSAVASLRTIHAGEEIYRDQDKGHVGQLVFATSLAQLFSTNAIIDQILGSGTKEGYVFVITIADSYHFEATADPLIPGRTGDRHFFIDDSGVIRYATSGAANSTSIPVGG